MSDEEDTPPEGLPDRRKHGYKDLERQLNEHVAEIEAHQKTVFISGLFAFALIAVTTMISIFFFGILLKEQHDQNNRLLDQAETIQNDRITAARSICENQNTNNKRVILFINNQAAKTIKNTKSEALRQSLINERDFRINLIQAVIPVRDCDKVANNVVNTSEKG